MDQNWCPDCGEPREACLCLPNPVVIDGKQMARDWRLVDMHIVLFGHLPEPGDEELTEIQYALRILKMWNAGDQDYSASLYFEAKKILQENNIPEPKPPIDIKDFIEPVEPKRSEMYERFIAPYIKD
jgi:hypothetical protein